MKPRLDIEIAPHLHIVMPDERSYAVIYRDKVLCCLDSYDEAVNVAKAMVLAFDLYTKVGHN